MQKRPADLAYGLTTAANKTLLAEGYTPGADYQLFVSSRSGAMLALPVDAGKPEDAVADRRDFQEGDPYWDGRLAAERREVKARRRDLFAGLLSALARAGITAPAGAEETLLEHESVPLTAA